jgi:hypothetical protein
MTDVRHRHRARSGRLGRDRGRYAKMALNGGSDQGTQFLLSHFDQLTTTALEPYVRRAEALRLRMIG